MCQNKLSPVPLEGWIFSNEQSLGAEYLEDLDGPIYAVIAGGSSCEEGSILCAICDISPCPFPVAVVFHHAGLDICSGLCNAWEFVSSFPWHSPCGLNYIYVVLGVFVNHPVSITAQRFVGSVWIMRLLPVLLLAGACRLYLKLNKFSVISWVSSSCMSKIAKFSIIHMLQKL